MTRAARILILGASGRLGTILRRHWSASSLHPVWQFRSAPETWGPQGEITVFDPLDAPPDIAPVDLVLGLAGVVPGKGDLALNTRLACAAVTCASALGAGHVMLSSSAAVYGGAETALDETTRARPAAPYGQAKLDMEAHALAFAAQSGVKATALRIGNVAGADALLGAPGHVRRLDQFESGAGPLRSYIGPVAFGAVLQALITQAISGAPLPEQLNLALRGGVAMADLCTAAGFDVTWHPAPEHAVEKVVLDVTRLGKIVPLPDAEATAIVADWQQDDRMRRGAA